MTTSSVYRVPNLRKHTSYDFHLWYASVKWYPGIFFMFSRFSFFELLRGSKDKKWPKMTKYYLCRTPYLRKHTSYDCDSRCTCVKCWHLQIKGQKLVQNDKKFCLSYFLTQEQYLTWLWFLVNICKMMIS